MKNVDYWKKHKADHLKMFF